jgi:hypothetical protein
MPPRSDISHDQRVASIGSCRAHVTYNEVTQFEMRTFFLYTLECRSCNPKASN